MIFFFAFLVLSGKLGKQSLRFRTTMTFFFGITDLLMRNIIQSIHNLTEEAKSSVINPFLYLAMPGLIYIPPSDMVMFVTS